MENMKQLTPHEAAVLADFLTQTRDDFASYCLFCADNTADGEHLRGGVLAKLQNLRKPQPDTADERQIALAEAQILGFIHGRDGYSLASLVESMGLKYSEWLAIKEGYPILCYLSEADRREIEETVKAV